MNHKPVFDLFLKLFNRELKRKLFKKEYSTIVSGMKINK